MNIIIPQRKEEEKNSERERWIARKIHAEGITVFQAPTPY